MNFRSFSKIIFQNEFLVAVDKNSGALTVPSRMGRSDPRPCLGIELQKFLKVQLYPVHRLDFEVSGIVIFAVNAQSQKILSNEFEFQKVHKTYDAYSSVMKESVEENQKLVWTCKLAKGKKRAFEAPHGKESITEALYLGMHGKFQHWHLMPKTGRSHQLRFEMYRHGCPIVGDALYGSSELFSQNAIALRAVKIEFERNEVVERLQMNALLEVAGLS